MRTLSSTLTLAQETAANPPIYKVVLSRTSQTTRGYDSGRIIKILRTEEPNSHKRDITLHNVDGALTSLDFEHYQAVISKGYATGVTRTAWAANTAYAIDDIVVPTTANGYQYRCSVAGTSHASTEPTWPTDLGITVVDNTPLTWEMDGNSGDEYSRAAPLRVRVQELHSGMGVAKCILRCIGQQDQLKEDKAIAEYTQTSSDTNTVKTLISAICAASTGLSSAYNGYAVITVVYDSEDSLIDSFIPADYFSISINANRWDKLMELLNYTGCKARFENDGKLHIFTPIISVPAAETLRPDAAGDETNITYQTPASGAHWDKVDEAVADDTDRVWESENDTWRRDLYNLPSLAATAGIINKITVYARAVRLSLTETYTNLKIAIKTGGVAYESAEIATTSSYAVYSKEWTTNPNTGVPWTIADINALQIGIALFSETPSYNATRVSQLYVEITFGYHYEYKWNVAGDHLFWNKSIRLRFIQPNKETVKTPATFGSQYTGSATSATSYALDPKTHTTEGRFVSNAQCDAVAAAIIERYELDDERGMVIVPPNVGQELWDYVKVTDSVSGDTRIGNIQYIGDTVEVFPGTNRRPAWNMVLSFGKVTLQSLMAGGLAGADRLGHLESLVNILIDQMKANWKETVWIEESAVENLDELADGIEYKRLLATQISAGKIYLSDVSTFMAGYDPSGKRRVFTATPTTPYDVGDLWADGTVLKRCTTARASGAYQAGDWTAIDLDELADGSTYQRVKATEMTAGVIKLYSGTIKSAEWYDESGVVLHADYGIALYGGQIALRTFPTYNDYVAGTNVQCYVGTDGKLYAGDGAVLLDANGITISGQYLLLKDGTNYGYLYKTGTLLMLLSSAGDVQIAASGATGKIWLNPQGVYVNPFYTNTVWLGDDTYYWKGLYVGVITQKVAASNLLYDILPFNTTTWLGRDTGKFERGYFTNLPSCPEGLPTQIKGLDTLKKVRSPTLDISGKVSFKDDDFPSEMKIKMAHKDEQGNIIEDTDEEIEYIKTIGVLVQAVRELTDKVDKLEAKISGNN